LRFLVVLPFISSPYPYINFKDSGCSSYEQKFITTKENLNLKGKKSQKQRREMGVEPPLEVDHPPPRGAFFISLFFFNYYYYLFFLTLRVFK
jgi:hypothetical protein